MQNSSEEPQNTTITDRDIYTHNSPDFSRGLSMYWSDWNNNPVWDHQYLALNGVRCIFLSDAKLSSFNKWDHMIYLSYLSYCLTIELNQRDFSLTFSSYLLCAYSYSGSKCFTFVQQIGANIAVWCLVSF